MAAVAMAPFLVWVAIFTVQMGHVGYNTGSANLAWNLRSKVLITERANGIEVPADVQAMEAGIPFGRFLTEVRAHPVPFAKAFLLDTATVFLRGNTTKITVDYLGIDRDPKAGGNPCSTPGMRGSSASGRCSARCSCWRRSGRWSRGCSSSSAFGAWPSWARA
jgi:hypothetical protein